MTLARVAAGFAGFTPQMPGFQATHRYCVARSRPIALAEPGDPVTRRFVRWAAR